jgi:hypothetical protein
MHLASNPAFSTGVVSPSMSLKVTHHSSNLFTKPGLSNQSPSAHNAINDHSTLHNNIKKLTGIYTPIFVGTVDNLTHAAERLL